MKRLFVCLFVLAVAMAACSAFAGQMQFVVNPGFEDGTGTAADPWYNQPAWGVCTGQAVTSQAHTGVRSWETTGADAGATDCVEQIVPIIPGGLAYAVSYWVKVPTASPSNPAKVDIRAWFGTPSNLYISGFWSVGGASAITVDTPDWTQVTDGVGGWIPDPSCTQVVLRARVTSISPTTLAYIDDASVTASAHYVTGKVVDSTGAPLANMAVYASNSNPPGGITPSAVTAADGTYKIGVADGVEQYVIARDPSKWYGDSTVATVAASSIDQVASDLVMSRLSTVKITGKLVDSVTKAPLAGATVGVNDASGLGFVAGTITGTTAADGTFELSVLDSNANPIGTYEYYVVAKQVGYFASETYVDISVGVVNGVKDISNVELTADPEYVPGLLVNLNAKDLALGADLASWPNRGTVGGTFDKFSGGVGPEVAMVAGKKAVKFVQPSSSGPDRRTLASSIPAPASLSGNHPWTVSSVLYRDSTQPGGENSYLQWAGGSYADAQSAIFRYTDNGAYIHWGNDSGFSKVPSANAWHNVTITYDGTTESIYVDGVLDKSDARNLSINAGGLMIVGSRTWHDARGEDQYWRYNGSIASIKIFDKALTAEEVAALASGVTYTITASAGEGGTISPSGDVKISEGDSPAFTFTPAIGYKIADVQVDGVSNADAVAAGSYSFTNVVANHTIAVSFSALPTQVVTGKVTDGTTGIAGAKVCFKTTANATLKPWVTTTTDANGNYSQTLPAGDWYVAAIADRYNVSSDTQITVASSAVSVPDIVLTVNPNWDVLFSASVDAFSGMANGDAITGWATTYPEGKTMGIMGTPTVETIDGVNWEKNVALTYNPDLWEADGFSFATGYVDPIPVNGASVVVAIRPNRNTTPTGWCSIVDVFYNQLVLGIHNDTGAISVWRNTKIYNSAADVVPNGQKTVLSLVVQPTGEFKVWANGIEVMNETSTADMTALTPNVPGGFANGINVGRNQPDGWTTFNGNIGEVYVYKTAISDEKREALQSSIATKLNIHVPVFVNISGKAVFTDGTPIEGATVTCIGDVQTTTTTAADGTYTIKAESGKYVSITAMKDSLLMVLPVEGQYDFQVGETDVTGKDFQFTPINTVTGIVKDVNGKPINNAVVQIGGIGGPGALTGPDGKYVVSGITPSSSTEFYADALGYAGNTLTVDTNPAATGPFNYDITLTAKNELGVIKNGGFEQVTNGVPDDWKLIWLRTATDWAIVYDNPVAGNTDIFSATSDCVTGSYAAKYSTTSVWTFMTQEIKIIPGSTYNFYMKLKGDAGVPNIFPMFAFRNDANEELAGYVSAEAAPYKEWAFTPPTTWKSFLHWNTYGNGLAHVPSLRLTAPANATKVTVWIGVTDAPAGKAIYADDVVVDRVGPDTPPVTEVTSVKNLKAQPVGSYVKLVGSMTVTLAPTADGVFYVGDSSRINGLRVVKSGAVLNAGDTVTDLTGTVKKTAAGEVYLELDAVPAGTAGTKIAPLAMNNRAACEDTKALSNLVKVWGKVTVSGSDFTITDGYNAPITVLANGATLPSGFDGSTVAITGVVSKDDSGKTVILLGSL